MIAPVAPLVDWFGDGSVVVADLALACCAVESEFAVPEGARRVAEPPPGARVVVVLSGTLTDALSGLVERRLAEYPGAHVVSFGACACAGGPYWDAWSVAKGVDQLVDVDTYIAGCPPPPDSLAQVVQRVRDEVTT